MKKIEKLIPAQTNMLVKLMNKAIENIAGDHGLLSEEMSMSYVQQGGNATFKFVLTVPGIHNTVEGAAYIQHAKYIGMKEEWLGQTFSNGNLRLIGFKPKATKRPILVENLKDGEKYVYSKEYVIQLFKLQENE